MAVMTLAFKGNTMSSAGFLLLRESTHEQIEFLTESTATGKNLFIEGPFISCNMKNRNGRVYPKGMMEKVVQDYINEYILERRSYGEFIHPDYPLPNPKMAALRIDKLEWRGDQVWGRAKVLDSMDEGKKLRAIIEEGFKLGVSTRGMGTIASDKSTVAQYKMHAVDAVDMPSGQPCYFDAVNESALWFQGDKGWEQRNSQGHVIQEAGSMEEVSKIKHDLFLEGLDRLKFNAKR